MTRVTMVDDMACRNNGKDINRVTSIAAETLITAYISGGMRTDIHKQNLSYQYYSKFTVIVAKIGLILSLFITHYCTPEKILNVDTMFA